MAEKSLAGRADLDASGEAVRWFRQEADLTQAEVAEQMAEYGFPWHTSTVSKTESGARDMSVSELEQLFLTKYGLNAQVFRRSGNLWLQTSATDHWTLAEQNRKGGHSEELFELKSDETEG